jgi:hypothetical protein
LWLAAYKTAVLKAITPLDESLANEFVDADIALSLQSLGFTAAVCDEFVGQVEDVDQLIDEANLAHGTSAQRAKLRHETAHIGGLMANLFSDLVRSPISTWRIRHLFQRLLAKKWSDADLQHANRLTRLAKERPWEASAAETGEASAAETGDASWRRAA